MGLEQAYMRCHLLHHLVDNSNKILLPYDTHYGREPSELILMQHNELY